MTNIPKCCTPCNYCLYHLRNRAFSTAGACPPKKYARPDRYDEIEISLISLMKFYGKFGNTSGDELAMFHNFLMSKNREIISFHHTLSGERLKQPLRGSTTSPRLPRFWSDVLNKFTNYREYILNEYNYVLDYDFGCMLSDAEGCVVSPELVLLRLKIPQLGGVVEIPRERILRREARLLSLYPPNCHSELAWRRDILTKAEIKTVLSANILKDMSDNHVCWDCTPCDKCSFRLRMSTFSTMGVCPPMDHARPPCQDEVEISLLSVMKLKGLLGTADQKEKIGSFLMNEEIVSAYNLLGGERFHLPLQVSATSPGEKIFPQNDFMKRRVTYTEYVLNEFNYTVEYDFDWMVSDARGTFCPPELILIRLKISQQGEIAEVPRERILEKEKAFLSIFPRSAVRGLCWRRRILTLDERNAMIPIKDISETVKMCENC